MSSIDSGIAGATGILTALIPITAAVGVIGVVSQMGNMTQQKGFFCRDCGMRHPDRAVVERHVREAHGRDPNAGQLNQAQQKSGMRRDITDSTGWLKF